MLSADIEEPLCRLEIPKDGFRVLGVLALVHVAWAAGNISPGKRRFLVRFARGKGWLSDGGDAVLERWLNKRPSDADVTLGLQSLAALAREEHGLGASVPEETLAAVILACREAATAPKRLFQRQMPISPDERAALQLVADSLAIMPGKRWEAQVAILSSAQRRDVAPGPEGHFLLGNALEMRHDIRGLLVDAWLRFGDVTRIRVGPTSMFLAVHPDDVRHVLGENNRNYVRSTVYAEVKHVIGTGLITSDGDFWLRQRRLIQPAFHQQKIAAMASMMTGVASEVLVGWRSFAARRRPVDIAAEMSRITLGIAGRTLFSMNTTQDEAAMGAALPVLFNHIITRTTSLVKLPEVIPTPKNRRFLAAIASVDRIIYRTIAARRRSEAEHHDLLSLLMAARHEGTGEGMSDEQLRTELMTLFVAGHDTTAATLSWLWWQLSRSPEILQRLQAEVDAVLGGRTPTDADVPKLSYMRAVIEEVMRLRPAGWLFGRKAIAEDRLSGYRVPAGSDVLVSPYLTHRHPAFWSNPEGFDPTRFLPEQAAGRHPYAYIPFGAGPRRCIGAQFAMMELYLVTAMVLQAYELHLAPGYEPTMACDFTMRPLDGCWMTVRERSPSTSGGA